VNEIINAKNFEFEQDPNSSRFMKAGPGIAGLANQE